MKIHYTIEQRNLAEGVIDLDTDIEWEWENARSDEERRAIIEPLVRRHAQDEDAWQYDLAVGFMPED